MIIVKMTQSREELCKKLHDLELERRETELVDKHLNNSEGRLMTEMDRIINGSLRASMNEQASQTLQSWLKGGMEYTLKGIEPVSGEEAAWIVFEKADKTDSTRFKVVDRKDLRIMIRLARIGKAKEKNTKEQLRVQGEIKKIRQLL